MGWPFVQAPHGGGARRRTGRSGSRASSTRRRAAASLGQVHRAIGARRRGAGLQAAISRHGVGGGGRPPPAEADLLRSTSATTARSHRARSTPRSPTRLREELDYEREARHMRALPPDAGGRERRASCPSRCRTLSTKRLLTMTWLEGKPLMRLLASSRRSRCATARLQHVPRLVRAVLRLRRDPRRPASRQLHGRAPTGDVNLLDFGCIRVFPPSFVKGVIDLYCALLRRRPRARGRRPTRPGASSDLAQRDDRRPQPLGRTSSTAPLMEDEPRLIQDDRDRRLRPRGGREASTPSCAGSAASTPPREFVLHGPRRDRPRLGVHAPEGRDQLVPLFHELIDDFDVKALEKRQKAALKKAGVTASR